MHWTILLWHTVTRRPVDAPVFCHKPWPNPFSGVGRRFCIEKQKDLIGGTEYAVPTHQYQRGTKVVGACVIVTLPATLEGGLLQSVSVTDSELVAQRVLYPD